MQCSFTAFTLQIAFVFQLLLSITFHTVSGKQDRFGGVNRVKYLVCKHTDLIKCSFWNQHTFPCPFFCLLCWRQSCQYCHVSRASLLCKTGVCAFFDALVRLKNTAVGKCMQKYAPSSDLQTCSIVGIYLVPGSSNAILSFASLLVRFLIFSQWSAAKVNFTVTTHFTVGGKLLVTAGLICDTDM